MGTFAEAFGDGGNLSELSFDWDCENCGQRLKFELVGCGIFVEWQSVCCGNKYIIQPYVAAYNKEKA